MIKPSLRGVKRRSNLVVITGSLRRCRPFLAAAIALLAMTALNLPLHAASSAEDLVQQALMKESVERDPAEAIKIYQRVVDDPSAPKATVAEARLRMGVCSEKLNRLDDAVSFYRQIVDQNQGVPADITQQARSNLGRLVTEKRFLETTAAKFNVVWVNRFIPTRFSLLLEPSFVTSSHATWLTAFSTALRYKLFSHDRPLDWFLDVRGTTPLGSSKISNQAQAFGAQETDSASLSLKYQVSLGIACELPHSQQRKVLPEIGAGLALTSSKISYTSGSSTGELSRTRGSPYVETGVHLFPDHILSGLLQIRYMRSPYTKSIDLITSTHSQTFNFPSSQWTIGATLQIKIGHFVREAKS